MRIIFTLLLIVFVATSWAQNHIKHQLIVQLHYKKNIDNVILQLNKEVESTSFKVLQPISKTLNIWLVAFDENVLSAEKAINRLEKSSSISLVQVNHNTIQNRVVPNDVSYGQQWCHFNANDADMDTQEAWDITTGGVTSMGDTIVVAVVDGGADLTHEDLDYWKNNHEIPNNGIDDDNNGYVDDYNGWHVYSSGGTVLEDENVNMAGPWDEHGVHVSGIIGAKGNNGVGVAGVSWNVKVMTVRGSSTNEAVLLKSYGYVYDQRIIYNRSLGDSGAYVVATNSSFGVDYANPVNYPIWCGLYDSLGAVGILSAVAGPNLGIDIDAQGDVPGTCPSNYTLSVSNSTNNDIRNSGAGYGLLNCDIAAPGTNIYSTIGSSGYGNKTGTSMATPQVAGAVGLMYAAVCPAMFSNYSPSELAFQLKNYMLTVGFDTIVAMSGESVTGGRLNVHKCLLAVQSNNCVLIVAGDVNGNGIIDGIEIAGDTNGNGIIDVGEIAGDTNGNGSIEFTELSGDINGNGVIDSNEILGDLNGNGVLDGIETGVNKIDWKNNISVYPNPAKNTLTITTEAAQTLVKLYTVDGRLLKHNYFNTKIIVDVSDVNAGIYFVEISNRKTKTVKRVIISR